MKSLLSLALVAMLATIAVAQESNKSQSDSDQTLKSIQKVCPVSGEELGEGAIKVEMDGLSMFVCCEGCKGKPAKDEHKKTIMARMAKAQGTCPIMKKKKVTADSKMTMVKGQPVFACCARCVSKIDGDGEAALKTVHANYQSFLSDETLKMAQKICPVSGQPLGDGAIKVTKEGEDMFVCCENCVEAKFSDEKVAEINANLAKAQGTCPVMTSKKVSAESASTVVNGRRVFACCKKCVAKVKSDPAKYVAKVNAQIKENAGAKQDKQ